MAKGKHYNYKGELCVTTKEQVRTQEKLDSQAMDKYKSARRQGLTNSQALGTLKGHEKVRVQDQTHKRGKRK